MLAINKKLSCFYVRVKMTLKSEFLLNLVNISTRIPNKKIRFIFYNRGSYIPALPLWALRLLPRHLTSLLDMLHKQLIKIMVSCLFTFYEVNGFVGIF